MPFVFIDLGKMDTVAAVMKEWNSPGVGGAPCVATLDASGVDWRNPPVGADEATKRAYRRLQSYYSKRKLIVDAVKRLLTAEIDMPAEIKEVEKMRCDGAGKKMTINALIAHLGRRNASGGVAGGGGEGGASGGADACGKGDASGCGGVGAGGGGGEGSGGGAAAGGGG